MLGWHLFGLTGGNSNPVTTLTYPLALALPRCPPLMRWLRQCMELRVDGDPNLRAPYSKYAPTVYEWRLPAAAPQAPQSGCYFGTL